MTGVPDRCPATTEVPLTDTSGTILTTNAGDTVTMTVRCEFERSHAADHQATTADGESLTWAD